MYDIAVRRIALAQLATGASLRSVFQQTGINRTTLREWRDRGPEPRQRDHGCAVCDGSELPDAETYLYLLGLYLGDGCISKAARTTALRIACADAWPGLADACAAALETVSGRRSSRVAHEGCQEILALWKHWPCLFPQHGRGRKHERSIVLASWQVELVRRDPRPLIRGLIHSDGYRGINWPSTS